MTLTVADLLEAPVMGEGSLLAGRAGIDRKIEWTSVIEWLGENFIHPDELVLTTCIGLAEPELTHFLGSLLASGAAAVCVSLPPGGPQIHPHVLDQADRLGVPLLDLPWATAFADVSRWVIDQVIQRGYSPDSFARTLLGGSGMDAIAAALEVALGRPVLIFDGRLQLAGYGPAAEAGYGHAGLAELRLRAVGLTRDQVAAATTDLDDEPRHLDDLLGIGPGTGLAVVAQQATRGYLYAPDLDEPRFPRLGRQALELGAVAVAVEGSRRDNLRDLADERAALLRIATLVARGTGARVVFDAVCAETGRLFGASAVNLVRFTSDGFHVIVGGWSLRDKHIGVGTRLPLETGSIRAKVWRTGAPVRLDNYEEAAGELTMAVRNHGIRCGIGVPLIVEGELWGVLIPARDWNEPFPADTEERLARFAELAATSISNATARSELIASRARIVAAGDEARRKIGRNLHDGIQQRLIALSLDVQSLLETLPQEDSEARRGLVRIGRDLEAVHHDLRELSRGLHPPLLSRGGLEPAMRALARLSPIPVTLQSDVTDRLPKAVEIGIYYLVAEALTNAAKYSGASEVSVSVRRVRQALHATIEDDGVGGADASEGSGLTGLIDRVAALGGRLEIDSRPGAGTKLSAVLPIADENREAEPSPAAVLGHVGSET